MFLRKMSSVNKVIVILLIIVKFSAIAKGQTVTRLDSKFRILAPEFICPKDENAVVEKLDNTIITLQTADANLHIEWTVRWTLLSPTPAQRFTLMLWSTVRRLERLLNKPQPEPYVYVIENSELLHGVNYTFNIVSIEPNGEVSESKSFHIDNTQGEQQLMIEGRNAMLSVLLVGAQIAYVDSVYIVDALITTCQPTHDYYFIWTVQRVSSEINDSIDLSHINGSRVEVPECTLKTGFIYTINCQVMRYNSGDLITKTSMPFVVQQKGIEVYLSVDYMVISTAQPFTMDSLVVNHDDCHRPVTLEWDCLHKADPCTAEMVLENGTLTFPSGLKETGDYLILLTITVGNQSNTANATIKVVQPPLPVIELSPVERKLNKGHTIELVANATNLTPACNLTWYFASEGYLASLSSATSTCDNCQHGVPLSETVRIISLEEQFLSELSDFSNETEWRQVVAPFAAEGGRARFLVECECSLINCYTRGAVYADVWFQLNEGPKVKDVLISPETGTALETVFRLSTLAADDPHSPLDYSFYCRADNDTILLASHVEHRAVETLLPYIDSGVEVWVKVCDNLGACSKSASKTVTLTPGHGRTIEELINEVNAHARRCELTQLERVVQSAIITYTNAHQSEVLTKFYDYLQISLEKMDKENCIIKYYGQYSELLYWLANHGVEIPNILITT